MSPFKCRGWRLKGSQSLIFPLLPSVPPENVFASSPGTHRLRTKRSLPSQRVSVTSSFPVLEEADAEEKEAFLALVGQMETGHSFSE